MNQTLTYHVYDKDGKFLAQYGIGWSIAEIFNGTKNSEKIILSHGQKEISTITRKEVIGVAK